MWEFVDKVVYINLDHREDRREIMQKLFNQGQIPSEKIERFSAIRHPVGIIGCAKGHIAILKRAKEQGWKNVLILEDDLTWTSGFEENYTKLENLVSQPSWDVCMLGGLYMETTPPKIHIAFCTNAYIVQSHYYDTLLENFEYGLRMKLDKHVPKQFGFPRQTKESIEKKYNELVNKDDRYNIDVYWWKLQLRDNWIAIIEPMIEQIVGYSDIYGKEKNHQTFNSNLLLPFVKGMKYYLINNIL